MFYLFKTNGVLLLIYVDMITYKGKIKNVTFLLEGSCFKKKGSKKGGQSTSLISNSAPNGLINLSIKSILALNLPASILLMVVLVNWDISDSWDCVRPFF